MNPSGNLILVPGGRDLLDVAARHIVERSDTLPELAGTVVLLPELHFAAQLRLRLLQAAERQGHAALLGPVITTPGQWLDDRVPLEQEIPARARRELMLVEVLQQHPAVFGGSNPWQVAASLVGLFEELTLHRVPVPDDPAIFATRLQRAYGIDDRLPAPLGREADMVHRLWQAWHTQLQAENLLDPGAARLQQLAATLSGSAGQRIYLVGFDDLTVAETEWAEALLAGDRAIGILHRDMPGPQAGAVAAPERLRKQEAAPPAADPFTRCLDAALAPGAGSPAERAASLAAAYPRSPLEARVAMFPAASAEREAGAIDLQVRQWLLEDNQPVGIVTEDRRLARRVRALLERAGISPQDIGGWALSTTSAAAALERWLETVEEDFAHRPLLDVLKSPFSFPDEEQAAFVTTVHRFEQDIVQHENIARGLERYRRHIELRRQRLEADLQAGDWTRRTAADMQVLLNRLDQAADPLRELVGSGSARPVVLLERLRTSLEALGMWAAFNDDPAGLRIIAEWQLLHAAARRSSLAMSWLEFRAWFGAALERHDFKPALPDSPVVLLTLQQAQLGRYAALVIGACDREHLPVRGAVSPFFNDPVRRELGLPVWPERYALQLSRFRRLLQAAPRVLLTWHRQDNGEPRMPGPWVAALQNFHRLGWRQDLTDTALGRLLDSPDSRVRGDNPVPVPRPSPYPAAVLPTALLPPAISVSAHDDLLDCPYRFFAARGLGLRPRETVREALEKSDYGERIHRCLEVFHQGRATYPPAFAAPLTGANRAAAVAALVAVSRAVFARDLEDNFEHRAWLRRWLELIPDYIDWQIARQPEWTFTRAEVKTETTLGNGRVLAGRLDRIDTGPAGTAIIDYKTGNPPIQAEVDSGEKVQLASYALLLDTPPAQVGYLRLDRQVRPGASLAGAVLEELAAAVRERLEQVLDAIDGGAPLPAWGDERSCRFCPMDVICRRQAWLEPGEAAAGGDVGE
ncbi:MAG: PD-(D/E)XK nuclease family protein [Gammaproteobacteria bacterium]|jgi:ATP-dependent helicase/nuclease subunit B